MTLNLLVYLIIVILFDGPRHREADSGPFGSGGAAATCSAGERGGVGASGGCGSGGGTGGRAGRGDDGSSVRTPPGLLESHQSPLADPMLSSLSQPRRAVGLLNPNAPSERWLGQQLGDPTGEFTVFP